MSNLRIDNIAPSAGGTYRNAPRGIAAAWVNFNGTSTVAIRDSENVASLTDNSVGNFTINFTTAMADTNYCALITGEQVTIYGPVIGLYTTAAYRLASYVPATSAVVDRSVIGVALLGDLA